MFSRLYPIVDVDCLRAGRDEATLFDAICQFAMELAEAGVTVIQYRAKSLSPREILAHARELRRMVPRSVKLVMNDRADICLAGNFEGVHVGQEDLSPSAVRGIIGTDRLLGVSTHSISQFEKALESDADYLAVGPIYSTASKVRHDPVVGLELIRAARAMLTQRNDARPLVAIGGITRANAAEVVAAGADSVAVIADLVTSPRVSAEAFLSILL